jgi:uncharacterized RDD family membrane protein YckC
MGARLIARVIDVALVMFALLPLYLVASWIGLDRGARYDDATRQIVDGANPLLRYLFTLVAVAAVVGYEVVLTTAQGATLGKRVLHLQVVRRTDGTLPTWGPAVIRLLVPASGLLVCFVGSLVVYASPLLDSSGYNRGWHDLAAGTVVIRT